MYKDIVIYDIGDAVIPKHGKSKDVLIVQSFKFIGEEQYQILYFEDPPKIAHVANDFYPADKELRDKYEMLSKISKTKLKKSPDKRVDDKIDDLFTPTSKEGKINFKLKL
jgi:hypothetical protein